MAKKYLTLNPDLLSKVATLLHRQNPQILSIEYASDRVEHYVRRVQKKGRKSGDNSYEIGTAGYTVRWNRDEEGSEEVNISLNVVDLWFGPDGEKTEKFVWGAIDRLKTVPATA